MPKRTLVITEKPSSARRIAQALDDDGCPESLKHRDVTYYLARNDDEELVIVSAIGHLYTIAQVGKKWVYPVFDIEWVPSYKVNKSYSRTRKYIQAIKELSKDTTHYVSACDYDLEGSLIAYNILRYTVGEQSLTNSRRMLYSTLTRQDLEKAWKNMPNTLDYPEISAGKTRHELDWIFGINLSRALALSVRTVSGNFKTLSIGRVQGPTLNFVNDREAKIQSFVPVPYWKVNAETMIQGQTYPLEYEKPMLEREVHAKKVADDCRRKQGTVIKITKKTEETPPHPPFNLGDLQREAYRVFKHSPSDTLKAAERLYLAAHISYPRTSSQKLPPSLNLKEILEKLGRNPVYSEQVQSILGKKILSPRQGRKDDSAHPAIHPTGSHPKRLKDISKNVYDLICKRFLAAFGDSVKKNKVLIGIDVNGHGFSLSGSETVDRGWYEIYPFVKDSERVLPELKTGMTVPITRLSTRRNYTKQPSRFNQISLLRFMENQNIGTKATRTNIIDTLYKRGYIQGNPIRVTTLGTSIIETLHKYIPEILSVNMTRDLEEQMENIRKGELDGETFIQSTIETLDPILKEFKENEEKIGAEIAKTLTEIFRKENYLGKCPSCTGGEIFIERIPKTGRVYARCINVKKGTCEQTYRLPQRKKIYSTRQQCRTCGSPVVKLFYGRKPWILCLNRDCPTKKGEKTI